MTIKELENGSIGFIDPKWPSKIFGIFAAVIGGTPILVVWEDPEVSVVLVSIFGVPILLVGLLMLAYRHTTWVSARDRQVVSTTWIGLWPRRKYWSAEDGGALRVWAKVSTYTQQFTCGLGLETEKGTIDFFTGYEAYFIPAQFWGNKISSLLELPIEEQLSDAKNLVIYRPPFDKDLPNFDGDGVYTHIGKRAHMLGYFLLVFSAIMLLLWSGNSSDLSLTLMLVPIGSLIGVAGFHCVRRYRYSEVNLASGIITYSWRNFFVRHSTTSSRDFAMGILVHVIHLEESSMCHTDLFFEKHSMTLVINSPESISREDIVNEARGIASQLNCPVSIYMTGSFKEDD